MRHHPISPVTEPLQYRAIGVVRGTYEPSDPEQLTRGLIRTADGSELEAVVLGRVLTLMRRHLDLGKPHLWVAYPRYREADKLHLQLVGVWEPSTLAAAQAALERPESEGEAGGPSAASEPGEATAAATTIGEAEAGGAPAGAAVPSEPDAASAEAATQHTPAAEAPPALPSDALPEGDDYFSVRGELIYTRPESGEVVVKIRQQPRPDGSRPTPFKLQLQGEIPLEHLRHFVSLDLRRQGQVLAVEAFEVIAPIPQRGNRGGKAKGRGGRPSGGGGAPGRGGRPAAAVTRR